MLDKTEICPMGSGRKSHVECYRLFSMSRSHGWSNGLCLQLQILVEELPILFAFQPTKWGFTEVLERLLRAWDLFILFEAILQILTTKKDIITNPCKCRRLQHIANCNYTQLRIFICYSIVRNCSRNLRLVSKILRGFTKSTSQHRWKHPPKPGGNIRVETETLLQSLGWCNFGIDLVQDFGHISRLLIIILHLSDTRGLSETLAIFLVLANVEAWNGQAVVVKSHHPT